MQRRVSVCKGTCVQASVGENERTDERCVLSESAARVPEGAMTIGRGMGERRDGSHGRRGRLSCVAGDARARRAARNRRRDVAKAPRGRGSRRAYARVHMTESRGEAHPRRLRRPKQIPNRKKENTFVSAQSTHTGHKARKRLGKTMRTFIQQRQECEQQRRCTNDSNGEQRARY